MIGYIKEFFYRLWLLVGGFFDDNVECSWEVKWQITKWISRIHRFKGVSINKFSDLFSKYEDISFPIRVLKNSDLSVLVESKNDTLNLDWWYPSYDRSYVIWKRKYPLCEDFTFEITEKNEIILKAKGVLMLKEDGTNDNERGDFNFSYDYEKNETTATLKQEKKTIKIVYTSQDKEFDKKILNILFGISFPRIIFHDVIPIFININNIRMPENLSIKSMQDSKELSEIVVLAGKVKKYSFSVIKDTSETLYTEHYKKDPRCVEDFISKYI